jgi:2'-5' RNA ligase
MPSQAFIRHHLQYNTRDMTTSLHFQESHAYTTACRADNFVRWHMGRPFYAVWIVEVDTAEVRAQISALRRHLGDWLLPDYRRQPHITLAVCGFPQAQATDEHSYTAADFHRDIACLQATAPATITVETALADSFTTAAYLGLRGETAALHAMRTALRGDSTPPFVPHITAGFYRRSLAMTDVQQKLNELELPEVSLEINAITLAVYASAEIAGHLVPVCRYPLQHSGLQVLQPDYLPWRTELSA